jgi:hypothetical protein
MRRAPHAENPIEVRQAFQRLSTDLDGVEQIAGEVTAVGAEGVNDGQPLYRPAGLATVGIARADTAVKARVCGFATRSAASGENVTYIANGFLSLDDWTDVLGSTSLTPGSVYYLGATGGITTTAPSTPGQYVTEVGQAASSTTLHVAIKRPILL